MIIPAPVLLSILLSSVYAVYSECLIYFFVSFVRLTILTFYGRFNVVVFSMMSVSS